MLVDLIETLANLKSGLLKAKDFVVTVTYPNFMKLKGTKGRRDYLRFAKTVDSSLRHGCSDVFRLVF